MKKAHLVIVLALFTVFSLTTSAEALVLSYVDTQFGGEISYELDIKSNGLNGQYQNTYEVWFTISTNYTTASNFPPTYADWVLIHFTVPAGDVSYLGPAGWSAWDPFSTVTVNGKIEEVMLWHPNADKYNVIRPTDRSGFYLTLLDKSNPGDEDPGYQDGVEVTADGQSETFHFYVSLLNPLDVSDTSLIMPFQVGYYTHEVLGNPKDKVNISRLSAELAVPEPTTMLLFGTGLIGLAGLKRKRFILK